MFLDNISPWNEYNVRPTVPPFCSNNQNNSTSSPGFLGQWFNMTVQYDSWAAGYFELCVWFFYPIRNGEIFWMNNNNAYWTVYIMDNKCTCYCTPCKWRSCTLVGYSTAKFFTFLPCLYSVILWSYKFLGKCMEESNREKTNIVPLSCQIHQERFVLL